MNGPLLLALLTAAAGLAVAWPLAFAPPSPLGRGLEDDAPVARWEGERARLIAAMRDNDLALAECRLDARAHETTAARLAVEAERVLGRLRAARGQFAPAAEARAGPGPGRLATLLVLALTLAAGFGAERVARWQDIDLTGSPHADGSVPLDGSATGAGAGAAVPPAAGLPAGSPLAADDAVAPDIGAMVERLEARVAAGDAGPGEIKMLLRSYDSLGRMADARRVLEDALARFPDDPDFQIGWLRAVITLPAAGDPARALPVAERLIAAMPDLLEARWYRSLLLAALGRREDALAELMWIAPRLPAGSPAHAAVTGRIEELSRPPG